MHDVGAAELVCRPHGGRTVTFRASIGTTSDRQPAMSPLQYPLFCKFGFWQTTYHVDLDRPWVDVYVQLGD